MEVLKLPRFDHPVSILKYLLSLTLGKVPQASPWKNDGFFIPTTCNLIQVLFIYFNLMNLKYRFDFSQISSMFVGISKEICFKIEFIYFLVYNLLHYIQLKEY